jgi:hypothetical protein
MVMKLVFMVTCMYYLNTIIKENSYSDYLDKEIDKGIRAMDSLGFNCVSFAYPYGAKYWFTDFLLLKKFKFLRGVAPLNEEKNISKIDEVYYLFDDNKTLSAIGFDDISGVTQSMIDVVSNIVNNSSPTISPLQRFRH